MKKLLAILLAVFMLLSLMACAAAPQETEPEVTEEAPPSYSDVTVAFVGDSITRGTAMEPGNPIYWEIVNEKLQVKEVAGLGINGSCYSVTSEYGLRTEPLPNRYRSIPKTADIIFILLGTNDFNMNTPLGTIADTADLSFYGGMNYTFDRFAEEYPDATVILITPIRRHGVLWQNSQGLKLTDYNDAIKAAADKHGYILMDLYELTYEKITPGVLADAVHPNKYGHQIMAEAIITWLQENMETVLK